MINESWDKKILRALKPDLEKYYSRGVKTGVEAHFSASALHNFLDGVYDEIKLKTRFSNEEFVQLENTINKNVFSKEAVLEKLKNKRERLKKRISFIDDQIETSHLSTYAEDTISGGDRSQSYLSYLIGGIILLLLTLFLLLFYSSAGTTILYGTPKYGGGIFNPELFGIATQKGLGALVFILLFPMAFLAVGFGTYIALQDYSKTGQGTKSFKGLLAIASVTFLADFIIGYQIAKGIYIRDYQKGLYLEVWSGDMVFSDSNFYLVLLMGFALYLLWGKLLHYVLNHPYKYISNNDMDTYERVNFLEEESDKLNTQLSELENEISIVIHHLELEQESLKLLKAGKVPQNILNVLIKKCASEFVNGFKTCVQNVEAASDETEKIDKAYEVWLFHKLTFNK